MWCDGERNGDGLDETAAELGTATGGNHGGEGNGSRGDAEWDRGESKWDRREGNMRLA